MISAGVSVRSDIVAGSIIGSGGASMHLGPSPALPPPPTTIQSSSASGGSATVQPVLKKKRGRQPKKHAVIPARAAIQAMAKVDRGSAAATEAQTEKLQSGHREVKYESTQRKYVEFQDKMIGLKFIDDHPKGSPGCPNSRRVVTFKGIRLWLGSNEGNSDP
jgi:hypothetical protein